MQHGQLIAHRMVGFAHRMPAVLVISKAVVGIPLRTPLGSSVELEVERCVTKL